MPLTDGSRFACGYTTTRAVLGDAIALVRGDRFHTSDFTRESSRDLDTSFFSELK